MTGVPLLIGWVLERYCITGQTVRDGLSVNTYDYTLPMMIFAGFGVLALIFAFLLKAEDKRKGYGLDYAAAVSGVTEACLLENIARLREQKIFR